MSSQKLKKARREFLTTYAKQLGWASNKWADAARLLGEKLGLSARSISSIKLCRGHLAPEKVDGLRRDLGNQAEFHDPSCLLNPKKIESSPSRRASRKRGSAKKPAKTEAVANSAASPTALESLIMPDIPPGDSNELFSIRRINGQPMIVLPKELEVSAMLSAEGVVVTLRFR
jgi:hypothetical protein